MWKAYLFHVEHMYGSDGISGWRALWGFYDMMDTVYFASII